MDPGLLSCPSHKEVARDICREYYFVAGEGIDIFNIPGSLVFPDSGFKGCWLFKGYFQDWSLEGVIVKGVCYSISHSSLEGAIIVVVPK